MSRNVQTDQKGHRQLPMFESYDRSRSSESTRGGLHLGLAFVCFDSIYMIRYFEYVWMVCWTYHSRAVGYSKSKWFDGLNLCTLELLTGACQSQSRSWRKMFADRPRNSWVAAERRWGHDWTSWTLGQIILEGVWLITRRLDTSISYLNWAGRFCLQILELNLSWKR